VELGLTVREVARHFAVSEQAVRNWIAQGKLAAFERPAAPGEHAKLRVRVTQAEVDRWQQVWRKWKQPEAVHDAG
jgi:transposase